MPKKTAKLDLSKIKKGKGKGKKKAKKEAKESYTARAAKLQCYPIIPRRPATSGASTETTSLEREIVLCFNGKYAQDPHKPRITAQMVPGRPRHFKTELVHAAFCRKEMSEGLIESLPEFHKVELEGIHAITSPRSPSASSMLQSSKGLSVKKLHRKQSECGELNISHRKLGDHYTFATVQAMVNTFNTDLRIGDDYSSFQYYTRSERESGPDSDDSDIGKEMMRYYPKAPMSDSLIGQSRFSRHNHHVIHGNSKLTVGKNANHKFSLTSMNIRDNRLSDKGLTRLLTSFLEQGVTFCSALETLDVSENAIRRKGGEVLAGILKKCPCLRRFECTKMTMTDNVLRAMLPGLQGALKTLITLDLSNNKIHDAGCIALAKAFDPEKCSLQELNISWNCIQDKGAVAIFEILQTNKSIQLFDISWNAIGTKAEVERKVAKKLSDCLKVNETLLHVDLSQNQFTDFDCQVIGEGLAMNHTLLGLHMVGNQGRTDAYGHLLPDAEPWPMEASHASVVTRVKNSRTVTGELQEKWHLRDSCWICGCYREQLFTYVLGVANMFVALEEVKQDPAKLAIFEVQMKAEEARKKQALEKERENEDPIKVMYREMIEKEGGGTEAAKAEDKLDLELPVIPSFMSVSIKLVTSFDRWIPEEMVLQPPSSQWHPVAQQQVETKGVKGIGGSNQDGNSEINNFPFLNRLRENRLEPTEDDARSIAVSSLAFNYRTKRREHSAVDSTVPEVDNTMLMDVELFDGGDEDRVEKGDKCDTYATNVLIKEGKVEAAGTECGEETKEASSDALAPSSTEVKQPSGVEGEQEMKKAEKQAEEEGEEAEKEEKMEGALCFLSHCHRDYGADELDNEESRIRTRPSYRLHRMVPPGIHYYCFLMNDSERYFFDPYAPHIRTSSLLKLGLQVPVEVLPLLPKYLNTVTVQEMTKAEKAEGPTAYFTHLRPRDKNSENAPQKKLWTINDSLFYKHTARLEKPWGNRCFAKDWQYMKASKHKNPAECAAIQEILMENFLLFRNIHAHYACLYSSETFFMAMGAFSLLNTQCNIIEQIADDDSIMAKPPPGSKPPTGRTTQKPVATAKYASTAIEQYTLGRSGSSKKMLDFGLDPAAQAKAIRESQPDKHEVNAEVSIATESSGGASTARAPEQATSASVPSQDTTKPSVGSVLINGATRTEVELIFVSACISGPRHEYNSKRALTRFQFMDCMVAIANVKFVKTGKCANIVEALKKLIDEHLVPFAERDDPETFRTKFLYTEPCDNALRKNLNAFKRLYNKYSGEENTPLEDKTMCFKEWIAFCEDIELSAEGLAERSCKLAYVRSQYCYADVFDESNLFKKLTLLEFLEAVARVALSIHSANLANPLNIAPTDSSVTATESTMEGGIRNPGQLEIDSMSTLSAMPGGDPSAGVAIPGGNTDGRQIKSASEFAHIIDLIASKKMAHKKAAAKVDKK